jgi:hypothetical protein
MKWNGTRSVAVVGTTLAAFLNRLTPGAQEKRATSQEKISSLDYLVGTWSCGHTVGTFSGQYTTTYAKVLGGRWLKQTYDFPPGNLEMTAKTG